MFKFVIFRTPKPRRYTHKNIYYDPLKEAHEERQERIRKQMGIAASEDQPYKPSIKRGSFRRGIFGTAEETQDMRSERKRSNIRLIIILIILFGFAAFLYLTSKSFLG